MPERKLEKVKAFRHGVYRSPLFFSDSSSTAEMSHVTSSVVETTDTVTSSSAPASSEGFLVTSATPESPISAQMIQSTIAPFIRMSIPQLYSPLLVEKTKNIKKENQTNKKVITKTISLMYKLNYIRFSSSCYYIDFHTRKSEQTNKYP